MRWNATSRVEVEEFYPGVLLTSDGRNLQMEAWSAVMRVLLRSDVVKEELSSEAKLLIYCSVYETMPPVSLFLVIFLACPTRKRPLGRTTNVWWMPLVHLGQATLLNCYIVF